MKRIGKTTLAAGSAVLMMGALAGCGSSSNASTTSAASSTAQPLIMAPAPYGSYTDNFNPFSTSNNPGTDGFIYEPLFYFSTVSSNQYGLLGQSYQWSDGGKTLTVDLRTNVKWTNGTPFTSKDVVFTFNLLKQNPALDTSGVWTKLQSVTAPNAHTVVFQFNQTDVPFGVYVLETYIVPESIWSKISDPAKYMNSQPVGTGPYLLSSFNAEDYKFTANPHYYLGKPKVPVIEVPAYDSNNSLNEALAAGQVGWSGQFIPDIKGVYTSKSPNNHYWFAPYEVVGLFPNLKNPLLSQLAVRQAINLAINRSELGQKGEYGYEKAASPTALVLPFQKSYLNPSLPVSETYNPTKAEQILEKAGFKKNASGVFVSPSGQPLSLTIQVPAGWSDWDADCAIMAQELSAIGIQTTVTQDAYGEYVANLQGGKYDLAMSWTNPGPTPYYALYNSLGSTGDWNIEGWNNAATNNALNAYASSTNPAVQKQAIETLEGIMVNDLPFIPVLDGALWDEYSTANYTGWPTQSDPYVTNAPYSWPAPEIVVEHLTPKS
ncbi:MAG: ABC transporter substrate-binding protein [Sulfobacillus thermotolerans]|nr:ABC transporter substrate-binding protein [Sulfobacillus thermotolerans]